MALFLEATCKRRDGREAGKAPPARLLPACCRRARSPCARRILRITRRRLGGPPRRPSFISCPALGGHGTSTAQRGRTGPGRGRPQRPVLRRAVLSRVMCPRSLRRTFSAGRKHSMGARTRTRPPRPDYAAGFRAGLRSSSAPTALVLFLRVRPISVGATKRPGHARPSFLRSPPMKPSGQARQGARRSALQASLLPGGLRPSLLLSGPLSDVSLPASRPARAGLRGRAMKGYTPPRNRRRRRKGWRRPG